MAISTAGCQDLTFPCVVREIAEHDLGDAAFWEEDQTREEYDNKQNSSLLSVWSGLLPACFAGFKAGKSLNFIYYARYMEEGEAGNLTL